MAKLVFAVVALVLIHGLLSQAGSTVAATWLTGAIGCLGLVWFALARA